MPEPEPVTPLPSDSKPARRTRFAEGVDAVREGASTIARLSPQQLVQVIAMVVIAFTLGLFAYQSWRDGEERKAQRSEIKEGMAAQMRENNAQAEMLRQHCANENDKTRRDANEQVKNVLNAFLAEGEKNRQFQADENARFRREVLSHIKGGP